MKKEYVSPEFEIYSILMSNVLAASTYDPDPQDPTRDGTDDPEVSDL